jgi:hypothetical protein
VGQVFKDLTRPVEIKFSRPRCPNLFEYTHDTALRSPVAPMNVQDWQNQ